MRTFASSKKSADKRFDPEEIRRLVQQGKERGLIRSEGNALPIEKNGIDATSLKNVRSQWMDVDTATAERWLQNNFRNRPIKEDVVVAYARDMVNGVWVPTHQGVAFNDKDELIDGQHRLKAIILARKTIRMMVTFGLPSVIEGHTMTTMDAVDRGRTRSVADQLKIQHGIKEGRIIAAISMSIGGICYEQRTRRLSVGQTLDIYHEFQQSIDWVIQKRSKEHGIKAAGVLTGFAFALQTEGLEGEIAKMYLALVSGKELKKDLPIALLRKFLVSDEAKLLNRGSDRGLAELVLQGIFLQLFYKSATTLEPSFEGASHFRSVQKDRVGKIASIFALPQ